MIAIAARWTTKCCWWHPMSSNSCVRPWTMTLRLDGSRNSDMLIKPVLWCDLGHYHWCVTFLAWFLHLLSGFEGYPSSFSRNTFLFNSVRLDFCYLQLRIVRPRYSQSSEKYLNHELNTHQYSVQLISTSLCLNFLLFSLGFVSPSMRQSGESCKLLDLHNQAKSSLPQLLLEERKREGGMERKKKGKTWESPTCL